jgi:hypothetical protein
MTGGPVVVVWGLSRGVVYRNTNGHNGQIAPPGRCPPGDVTATM